MLGIDTWGLDVVLWFQSWRTPLIEWLALFLHDMGPVVTVYAAAAGFLLVRGPQVWGATGGLVCGGRLSEQPA